MREKIKDRMKKTMKKYEGYYKKEEGAFFLLSKAPLQEYSKGKNESITKEDFEKYILDEFPLNFIVTLSQVKYIDSIYDLEHYALPTKEMTPLYKGLLSLERAFQKYFIENMDKLQIKIVYMVIDTSFISPSFEHLFSHEEINKQLKDRISEFYLLNSFLFHVDDFIFLDFKVKEETFKGMERISF